MSDARTESDGTSTTTPELATWLLAQIDEDEQTAKRLHTVSCSIHPQGLEETWCDCGYPARVLAECKAKRRTVERYLATEARADELITDGLGRELDDEVAERLALEWVVRLLAALLYADRDGYRKEWKPQ